PVSTQEAGSNNQNTLLLKSRTNNRIQKEIIFSNRTAPSRLVTMLNSRENSLIFYNSTSELEPRNEFNTSNGSSRTKPVIVLDSRTNNQFNYNLLNRTWNSKQILLGSGDNTMNIQINNTCNMINTSIFHSDTINEVIPLLFDKISIYQL
ncbi:34745_t:CDS:1, partial [Racocetra persica]